MRLITRKFSASFLLCIGLLLACEKTDKTAMKSGEIKTPTGKIVKTLLALTEAEQTQGLSGKKPGEFSDNQAMLFFYTEPGTRSFWMPDTYFDLDIFFLDKKLKVIDVERDVKYHPGRTTPPEIPTTRSIYAFHILEMKASSPVSKEIKIGDTLEWLTNPNLEEIERSLLIK